MNKAKLRNSLTSGGADSSFAFGIAGDIPVAGAWAQVGSNQYSAHRAPSVLVPPTATPLPPTKPAPTYMPPPPNGLQDFNTDHSSNLMSYVVPPDARPLATTSSSCPTPLNAPIAGPANLMQRHIDYTYDCLNRLTSANYTDSVSWGKWNTFNYQYSYDLNSNRTLEQGTYYPNGTTPFVNTSYAYNTADQLTTSTDWADAAQTTQVGVASFVYTVDGQLSYQNYLRTGQSNAIRQYTYGYDTAGRLASVSDDTNNILLSYGYDGQNNRVTKGVVTGGSGGSSYSSSYLYDLTGQLPEIVGEFPSNASAIWYVPGGKALAQDTNGTLGYFAYDGLGTARALFDTTGAQRDLTNYDPYGQVIEHSNDLTPHLGFTGVLTGGEQLTQYKFSEYRNTFSLWPP